jgi:hypothetical protein
MGSQLTHSVKSSIGAGFQGKYLEDGRQYWHLRIGSFSKTRPSREGGNLSLVKLLMHQRTWIPAFAGTTNILGFEKFHIHFLLIWLTNILRHSSIETPLPRPRSGTRGRVTGR